MAELHYAPLESVEPAAVLATMNEAFGRDRDLDWYRWKHQEGPWGPSRGWVALDGGDIVGTRLFLPWRLRSAALEHGCARAVDGAVIPRARRRGVYSTLMKLETDRLVTEPSWQCMYSTLVPASREALRSLGWTILPVVPSAYRVVPPGRSGRGLVLDAGLDDVVLPRSTLQALSTAWTVSALRWRTDPRSGHAYRVALLEHGPDQVGLCFRTSRVRGVRLLVPLLSWGEPRARDRLLRQAAGAERCAVVLEVDRHSALAPLRAGGSTVSVWTTEGPGSPDASPDEARSWSWSGADLEGVL